MGYRNHSEVPSIDSDDVDGKGKAAVMTWMDTKNPATMITTALWHQEVTMSSGET